jgi:hypothetical protein
MQTLRDNCKTFFIAKQETSTPLPTWTKMLLASHTTRQERAHEEVIKVCGHNDHPIDLDMFNKLKTIVWIFCQPIWSFFIPHILAQTWLWFWMKLFIYFTSFKSKQRSINGHEVGGPRHLKRIEIIFC